MIILPSKYSMYYLNSLFLSIYCPSIVLSFPQSSGPRLYDNFTLHVLPQNTGALGKDQLNQRRRPLIYGVNRLYIICE